jgi:hypothetical protein
MCGIMFGLWTNNVQLLHPSPNSNLSLIGNPLVGLLHLWEFIPKKLRANKFLKINKKISLFVGW